MRRRIPNFGVGLYDLDLPMGFDLLLDPKCGSLFPNIFVWKCLQKSIQQIFALRKIELELDNSKHKIIVIFIIWQYLLQFYMME